MVECRHMLERVIHHEPSGIATPRNRYKVTPGEPIYTPGDRVVFSCPMGCEDIVIHVVDDSEKGISYDE